MKPHSVCLSLVVVVATLALSAAAVPTSYEDDIPIPDGVSPSNEHLYVPDEARRWKCLDGSKTISFSDINDDYCDCKDGSDEPGTSACGTGYFYCYNIGHVGSSIKTSRVNDGVCDPECCDGSDELYREVRRCPNVCEQVGAKAKEEQARIGAIQEQGSRLRKQYIEHGKSIKIQLQSELEELKTKKTGQLEKATLDAKDKLDKANGMYDKYLEGTKNEREAARKKQLEPLIQEQRRRLNVGKETKNHLVQTCQNLKENHNKNYHDLAVKDAVSAFDDFVSRQSDDDSTTDESDEKEGTGTEEEEKKSENESSADEQLKTLMDDTNTPLRDIGTLYELLDGMRREYNIEYNDEAVLAAVKVIEDFEDKWDTVRREFKDEPSQDIPDEEPVNTPEAEKLKEETSQAQTEYDTASNEESKVSNRIQDINRKLEVDVGPDEAFAQLIDQCFEYKDTEYTYSVCLFGEANQKSHSTTYLGKFSSWDDDDYSVQIYSGGTQCWNGPQRSVRLEMSCGVENQLVSVTEPSKCEYLFKLQTPAVCPVLPEHTEPKQPVAKPSSSAKAVHDEL
ncbi:hypothetical protein BGZ65_003363 [Modicella reniformis]|uniref:Glucosidase 2 subunit beta n=1 Tax=Modicella reniformis TaxID=1440133 RepID=A0A9P6LSM3_9FUNG|nr:hypothetical protein BGZ65_003363 [Modicella reniformis]